MSSGLALPFSSLSFLLAVEKGTNYLSVYRTLMLPTPGRVSYSFLSILYFFPIPYSGLTAFPHWEITPSLSPTSFTQVQEQWVQSDGTVLPAQGMAANNTRISHWSIWISHLSIPSQVGCALLKCSLFATLLSLLPVGFITIQRLGLIWHPPSHPISPSIFWIGLITKWTFIVIFPALKVGLRVNDMMRKWSNSHRCTPGRVAS